MTGRFSSFLPNVAQERLFVSYRLSFPLDQVTSDTSNTAIAFDFMSHSSKTSLYPVYRRGGGVGGEIVEGGRWFFNH